MNLSLHNLTTELRKRLKQVALFGSWVLRIESGMDVHKFAGNEGQICVSPIHRYLDSNLRFYKY